MAREGRDENQARSARVQTIPGACTPARQRDARELHDLSRVALGEQPADLVIRDGDLVNVYTGEVQQRCSLAIKGRFIAYVGRDAGHTIGPDTQVLDASGRVIIPGLIDGHTHVYNRCDIGEYVRHALPSGTTTVITETLELVFPVGPSAIAVTLANLRRQPMRMFATLPAMVSCDPPWPAIAPPIEEYARYLDDDIVLGVGESYWANTLRDSGWIMELFARTHEAGKSLEGHTAGARDRRLQAYLAYGPSSCHEPIVLDDVLALLRAGVHVLLREGGTRRDLAAVAEIRHAKLDLRRLAVCSDSVELSDLLVGKYMNAIVQGAIELGFDPVAAVQMASLNVAEHFHLDYWLGGLAPGKLADLAVVADLRRIEPECVVVDGRIVAREGRLAVAVPEAEYPEAFFDSIRLSQDHQGASAADFRVAAPAGGSCRVRAIEQISDLVTKELLLDLPASDGELRAQPERDVIKVAALECRKGEGERFVGFAVGHGLRRGAIASTITWDSTALLVAGANDADMALAVDELVRMRGGAVVCADGRTLAAFPAPVGGFVSQRPLAEVIAALDAVQRAAAALGSTRPRQLLTLETLSSPAIPHLRINHVGYHNLRDGRVCHLFD